MPDLYVGLMSGTSLDGVDACLVEFTPNQCHLVGFTFSPFSDQLRNRLKRLCNPQHPVLLSELGMLDVEIGQLFATTTLNLLSQTATATSDVHAIGSHGITLHHSPNGQHPFSTQIGDPNTIAECTGITTIADFRRRDMAAGGQGAPLVPAFHQYFFNRNGEDICILNIGGIANITLLNPNKTLGFDTGPGNTLMDSWTFQHHQKHYDSNGEWAASGNINSALLNTFKSDPYFQLPPPKSTGKEYFSAHWLQNFNLNGIASKDVQASLCKLSADTISDAIKKYAPNTQRTLVCGGGCHNLHLMSLLQEALPHPVESSENFGIDPDHVEAAAFAWLAWQTLQNQPGNLPQATGAKAPVVLGGIYPGRIN